MTEVPQDVRDYLRSIFHLANRTTAGLMTDMPTIHEETLDQNFITTLSRFPAPYRASNDWVVTVEAHFLGGGRHFRGREIADIGVLVVYRDGGRVMRSKVALLQSKRLFPNEQQVLDSVDANAHIMDFGLAFPPERSFQEISTPRSFHFDYSSQYRSLLVKGRQYLDMTAWSRRSKIPLFYLLYNPLDLPSTRTIPHTSDQPAAVGDCHVGARVVPLAMLEKAMTRGRETYRPSYADIAKLRGFAGQAGWRVEDFIADEMILCREGYIWADPHRPDAALVPVLSRRPYPISAQVSVTLDAPPGGLSAETPE